MLIITVLHSDWGSGYYDPAVLVTIMRVVAAIGVQTAIFILIPATDRKFAYTQWIFGGILVFNCLLALGSSERPEFGPPPSIPTGHPLLVFGSFATTIAFGWISRRLTMRFPKWLRVTLGLSLLILAFWLPLKYANRYWIELD